LNTKAQSDHKIRKEVKKERGLRNLLSSFTQSPVTPKGFAPLSVFCTVQYLDYCWYIILYLDYSTTGTTVLYGF
jgi:hypothetical protein